MRTEYYILITVFGWGIGSFIYKIANTNAHPIMVSTISMGLYIVLLPLIWIFVKFDHTVNISGIAYALLGALCMCIATLSFSYALHSGGDAGKITIMSAIYPALTLILSMIFLHETLSIKKWIGIVLALVSFVMMSLK
jgi:transporter family protein